MPQYKYQCSCGFRFDKWVTAKKAKGQACPECQNSLDPEVPASVNGVFNVKTEGLAPQSTGVHGVDTNYDRVIGASAVQGWTEIEKRQVEKARILRESGLTTSEHLGRTVDGQYQPLPVQERAAVAFTKELLPKVEAPKPPNKEVMPIAK